MFSFIKKPCENSKCVEVNLNPYDGKPVKGQQF